ncbi:MAG: hypothetical protein QG656_367, partial [Candidatus Hydrogenedentes bacterium]|nr:hypothetical protein [Candidatus Hydrogenedentota bacterium]
MKKMGVGIIGAGWVAGEHIRAFNTHPDTEVVALCSRDGEKAKAKAVAGGISCAILTDYEKLVARDDVDIVVVATPPHVHRAQAVAAAQAGKHLLLEKAMATNLDDC